MGGRGTYSQRGGFKIYEYESTGERIEGFKVIKHKTDSHASLPQMSNTPGTVYILKSGNHYKSIGIYGDDRRLKKEINISHGHTNVYANGKVEKLKRGVAHIHHWQGGRQANVRYLTAKEIKKYGKAIIKMGGKLNG